MGKYSNYKHVGYNVRYKKWQAFIRLPNGKNWIKRCKTEHEAAIASDKQLIELGREPVNILKRK